MPGHASRTGGTNASAIGGELRVETSAVDAADVNAAAVDGLKVEPVILAQLRLGRRFWLSAGYGLTIMPGVTVTHSAFDPDAGNRLRGRDNGDLTNADCIGAGGRAPRGRLPPERTRLSRRTSASPST